VHNVAEDAEEDEDDDYLQHHLDAVEVLKEHYFAQEGKHGESGAHPQGAHTPHRAHHAQPSPHGHAHNSSTPGAGAGGRHKASWRKVSVSCQGARVPAGEPSIAYTSCYVRGWLR
jgi:hypothetical protein